MKIMRAARLVCVALSSGAECQWSCLKFWLWYRCASTETCHAKVNTKQQDSYVLFASEMQTGKGRGVFLVPVVPQFLEVFGWKGLWWEKAELSCLTVPGAKGLWRCGMWRTVPRDTLTSVEHSHQQVCSKHRGSLKCSVMKAAIRAKCTFVFQIGHVYGLVFMVLCIGTLQAPAGLCLVSQFYFAFAFFPKSQVTKSRFLALSFVFFCVCLLLSAVSNRKAPPPVPPRTTSKPLISVTVQSSTESAQDTYLDQQDRGSEANSQSGRSNSSDSLCSIRTGSLAKGTRPPPVPVPTAAPAPAVGSVHPVPAPRDLPPTTANTVTTTTTSTSTQSQNDTLSVSITVEQPPTATKRKLSSIGIQVRIFCFSLMIQS